MPSLMFAVLILLFSSCAAAGKHETDAPVIPKSQDVPEPVQEDDVQEEEAAEMMRLYIDGNEVPVTWLDNDSVKELMDMAMEKDLRIEMSMYGGFEQVGPVGRSVTRNDSQTKTQYGDIVLYSGNQIVIFYGSNSWAYTRLGHVDLSEKELQELLRDHDVILTLAWR
ncbi:MAG: hypothetical protein IJG67_00020 [Oscillospiraceae bacterium]|nr:hypothetical protein [Oscillospiraceae bacterium]